MKPKGVRARHSTPECAAIAASGLILQTQVGSGLHGIAVGDQDDRDEMGICIEPPTHVIGPGRFQQYDHRTARDRASHDGMCNRSDDHDPGTCIAVEHARSGPGDVDLTVYSLRKWMGLALQGHPTILLPLFAPDYDVVFGSTAGDQLRALAPAIVSRRCGERFLGYLQAQRTRFEASGRGEKSNRPELIAAYGFDVKYAAHMIRIAVQGSDLMRTGRITLPMRQHWQVWLTGLRQGQVSHAEVTAAAQDCEQRLISDIASSPLPDVPEEQMCWDWVIGKYLAHWRTKPMPYPIPLAGRTPDDPDGV